MRRGRFDDLVHDQVAVVEGLDAEEVELQVGGGIERRGQPGEVVLEQPGVEALDRDAVLQVLAEGALVEVLQLADAVLHDVPAEHLLVEVGELDAAGEPGEVGVLLDQGLRVEDDRGVEVLLGDLVVDRAPQLGLDLLVGQAEVQADARELDPLAQVGAVPEGIVAVGSLDDDHGGLPRGASAPAAAAGSGCRRARAPRPARRGTGCRPRPPCSGRPSSAPPGPCPGSPRCGQRPASRPAPARATARVMATAGAESRCRDRNVLRMAISTFCSFHGHDLVVAADHPEGGLARRLAVERRACGRG